MGDNGYDIMSVFLSVYSRYLPNGSSDFNPMIPMRSSSNLGQIGQSVTE